MTLQQTLYTAVTGFACLAASHLYGQSPSFTPIDFPDAAGTQAWAINPRGDIVGSYTLMDKSSHGFLISGDRFETIDYPGGTGNGLGAINARGDVAGQYTSADNVTHGFILSAGAFTTIDYPGAKVTSPGAMNARGDVAGGYTAQDGTRHGFLYSGGKFITVDYPGATVTVPSGINARGDIAGGFMSGGVAHGFLFSNGSFTSYDFPGASSTQAFGISARGEIAGRYTLSGVTHGFLLSGGRFTTIDFPGASYTAAYFINTTDDVLGQYQVNGAYRSYLMTRRVSYGASYTVTDLGTLGGAASVAYGINDAGEVAGAANMANENQHPFIWSATTMTDLGTLGGPNGNVAGPNGSNEVAGLAETSTPDPNGEDFCGYGTNLICLGITWHSGPLTPLFTLGGNNSQTLNLNNRGQAVGVSETAVRDWTCAPPQALQFEAASWGPGANAIQLLPPLPGDTVGFALANNDKGQVVGSTGTCQNTAVAPFAIGPHAVMWDHGSPIALGTLGGKTAAAGASVNNRSETVGGSFLSDEQTFHSYLWAEEMGMIDTGTVGTDHSAYPGQINDSGQVVGASCDTNMSGNCRAYIWQYLGPGSTPAKLTDLNTLIPSNSPLYLVFAIAINNAGEIVGLGIDSNTGDPHAFLATPVPPGNATGAVEVRQSSRGPWHIPEKDYKLIRSRIYGPTPR